PSVRRWRPGSNPSTARSPVSSTASATRPGPPARDKEREPEVRLYRHGTKLSRVRRWERQMKRRAAIDIGTNSVRLLVVDEHGADLTRRSEVTGLGRGLAASARLNPEGGSATLEVLGAYAAAMAELRVERQRAVMTAAGRNATDTTEFLAEASEVLGFPIEVIPGEEEAALSYAGAASDLPGDDPVVVDIGGGS